MLNDVRCVHVYNQYCAGPTPGNLVCFMKWRISDKWFTIYFHCSVDGIEKKQTEWNSINAFFFDAFSVYMLNIMYSNLIAEFSCHSPIRSCKHSSNPKLLGCLIALSTNGSSVVALSKEREVSVDSWEEHVMKSCQVKLIRGIKNATFFHVVEQMVKDESAPSKEVPPEPFNSLIVDTATSNVAAPVRPSQRMCQHVPCYLHIFSSFIRPDSWWQAKVLHSCLKEIKYSFCPVVRWAMEEDNHSRKTINTTMYYKSPPEMKNAYN